MLKTIFIYVTNENILQETKGNKSMDVSIIKDLVDLARNGYKPNDVKELIGLMKEAQEPPKTEPPKTEPPKTEPPKTEPTKVVNAFEELIKNEVK